MEKEYGEKMYKIKIQRHMMENMIWTKNREKEFSLGALEINIMENFMTI